MELYDTSEIDEKDEWMDVVEELEKDTVYEVSLDSGFSIQLKQKRRDSDYFIDIRQNDYRMVVRRDNLRLCKLLSNGNGSRELGIVTEIKKFN